MDNIALAKIHTKRHSGPEWRFFHIPHISPLFSQLFGFSCIRQERTNGQKNMENNKSSRFVRQYSIVTCSMFSTYIVVYANSLFVYVIKTK